MLRNHALRTLGTLGLCLTGVVLSNCAGRLDNPELFTGGGPPDGGGGGNSCTLNVEADILASNTCSSSGCHAPPATASNGNLDLKSPGVAARLVNVNSTCSGVKLLSSPTEGFFLEKILKASPQCNGTPKGSRMPIGPALTDQQVSCIQEWAADAFNGGS
ncbi:MAG TPA: hypothetical protein VEY30_00080 [Myxococcaceae bacterium]|nr:hypothetical protein [Myxococcaceae bacterium]